MEKFKAENKNKKEETKWQDSIRELFNEQGVSFEENKEYFIYPITYKNGETVKKYTPKGEKMQLKSENGKFDKWVFTKDVIAAVIESSPEYTREDFSIIEAYKRYSKKHNIKN